MRSKRDQAMEACGCFLAGALPLALYLRTMAPTVYALDSAELTTGAYVLGIVHAPGSPTYLLLGNLFSRLPIGDVGFRLNLMSVCAAAMASALVHLLVCRLVGNRALALAGAWLLASTYYFWIAAIAAELYAPQVCVLAALLLLVFAWHNTGRPSRVYALALLFGLGLGIHQSLVLMLPGLVWMVFARPAGTAQRRRVLLGAAASALIGASVYVYLPLRYASGTPLNYARDYWQADLTTVSGFLWMTSGRMFAHSFFDIHIGDLPGELARYIWQLWSNFVGLGAVLGVIGLVVGWRKNPQIHVGLVLMFAVHVLFFLTYNVPDKQVMFLPTFLLWSLWVVIGVQRVVASINAHVQEGWAISGALILMFMAIANVVLNYSRVDLSGDWSPRVRGESILRHMPPAAVYFGTWGDVPILEYLQLVENQRRDVKTQNLVFMRGMAPAMATRLLSEGQPAYTSAPKLLGADSFQFSYVKTCQCYAVHLPGMIEPQHREAVSSDPLPTPRPICDICD